MYEGVNKALKDPTLGLGIDHRLLINVVDTLRNGARTYTSLKREHLTNSWVWDAETGELVEEGPTDSVLSVAFLPDGSRINAGLDDTTVRMLDAGREKQVGEQFSHLFEGPADRVISGENEVGFSPGGRRVAGSSDARNLGFSHPLFINQAYERCLSSGCVIFSNILLH